MILPRLHGFIERRILINYAADPGIVKNLLPPTFRPHLVNGKAILGVCLIRLRHLKPIGFPDLLGLSSENGAHRIAVEWDENGKVCSGVYIPRRDSSSVFNTFVGGRFFPGKHYKANFIVKEGDGEYSVRFKSSDQTQTHIKARESTVFNPSSVFGNLETASQFFKNGELGYSPKKNLFEGLRLKTYNWQARPLDVLELSSSFYEDQALFPKGSITFDNALLMTNIEHEWIGDKTKTAI